MREDCILNTTDNSINGNKGMQGSWSNPSCLGGTSNCGDGGIKSSLGTCCRVESESQEWIEAGEKALWRVIMGKLVKINYIILYSLAYTADYRPVRIINHLHINY